MDGTRVHPVDAATVILLRDAPTGPECFMVRRPIKSDFAADVFVFPGGKIDPADRPTGEQEGEATEHALRVGAIRELFEEAGVLLASRDGTPLRLEDDEAERFAGLRRQVLDGEVDFRDMVRLEGLNLALDDLVPFSRWITPEGSPRRYDTRFYLACMPEAQTPLHDARETVASVWISPSEALRQYEKGDFPLVFATEKHLERMARFSAMQDLISGITPADLAPVMPRVVRDGDELSFLLPGEPGYED
jgi:8-oxo-dGTP pyrophosphatase MutT (NUDIX family)